MQQYKLPWLPCEDQTISPSLIGLEPLGGAGAIELFGIAHLLEVTLYLGKTMSQVWHAGIARAVILEHELFALGNPPAIQELCLSAFDIHLDAIVLFIFQKAPANIFDQSTLVEAVGLYYGKP